MPGIQGGRFGAVPAVWSLTLGWILLQLTAAAAQDSTLPPVSDPPPYILTPTRVKAGAAFDLQVLSYDFSCAHRYDYIQVSVSGDTIDIRFLAENRAGILCPVVYKPYGPTVAMPALDSGSYGVYVTRLQPCQVLPGPCKITSDPVLAGTLYAYRSAADGWYIEPDRVQPDQAFTLKLLNDEVGNCQSSFDHLSWSFDQQPPWSSMVESILLTFVHRVDTSVVCIQDLRPFGPSFEMTGLPAGTYPVSFAILPECAFPDSPTGPVCDHLVAPQLAGTLHVGDLTGIRLGADSRARGLRGAPPFEWFYKGVPALTGPQGRLGVDGRSRPAGRNQASAPRFPETGPAGER